MQKKFKELPRFHSEEEEREFWSREDSPVYIDWSKAKKVRFHHLKPSTKSISLRLPITLLERLKVAANQNDIPYQSYLKILLHQGLQQRVAKRKVYEKTIHS